MKSILTLVLFFLSSSIHAQDLPDFSQIKLEQGSDYKPAEPAVLQAANYLLSTPVVKDDLRRLTSLQFIIRWMTGTPDYTFSLGGSITKLVKDDNDIMGVYLAAMVKYGLENPAASKDDKKMNLESIKVVLGYCEDPGNNIKQGKTLKKWIEANKNGTLESML